MKIFVMCVLTVVVATNARANAIDDAGAHCAKQPAELTIPENADASPIKRVMLCVTPMQDISLPMMTDLAFQGVSACLPPIGLIQEAMQKCVDDRIAAAVEAAKGKDDLRTAIKDFYLKIKAQIAAYMPAATQSKIAYRVDLSHAKRDADMAADKVILEAKLAAVSLEHKEK